ncbi:hypothetical protein AB0B12_30735 [Streptomyces sp. NPDC044780]|uniref:Uncharacterized protein n=1 Tax=Streptomyces luomodiensis TaxID=3026192 RepID=A0ABY9V5W6_9ACTN|nr:hypothetical protein [Streptomyces sp. SCA4-21]WNF00251.1 hypothetical protein PS467_35505 [Streptomyces sp. SCA4-21]
MPEVDRHERARHACEAAAGSGPSRREAPGQAGKVPVLRTEKARSVLGWTV